MASTAEQDASLAIELIQRTLALAEKAERERDAARAEVATLRRERTAHDGTVAKWRTDLESANRELAALKAAPKTWPEVGSVVGGLRITKMARYGERRTWVEFDVVDAELPSPDPDEALCSVLRKAWSDSVSGTDLIPNMAKAARAAIAAELAK